MAAAYSLYDLLDILIDRVAWPTENERFAAHESVQAARDVNLLGNFAEGITCEHPGPLERIGGWQTNLYQCPRCKGVVQR